MKYRSETEWQPKWPYLHPTCTGNSRYGSGDGSEQAVIRREHFVDHFGFAPRSRMERFLMAETLLAQDK